MTSYESASVVLAAIALVISTFSIMSALAAKRSALAAESQAQHAGTQAEAAKRQAELAEVQAGAAEQQVGIMQDTLSRDRIGVAYKIRRDVIASRAAVEHLYIEHLRGRGSREIHMALAKVREVTATIQDAPPVLPANVRAIMFGYTANLDGIDDRVTQMSDASVPRDALHREADTLIAAIDVAITALVQRLSE